MAVDHSAKYFIACVTDSLLLLNLSCSPPCIIFILVLSFYKHSLHYLILLLAPPYVVLCLYYLYPAVVLYVGSSFSLLSYTIYPCICVVLVLHSSLSYFCIISSYSSLSLHPHILALTHSKTISQAACQTFHSSLLSCRIPRS